MFAGSAQVKIHQILVILKQQISFYSNFTSLFSVMRHSSSILFYLKLFILSTKGAYQSTNFVKFYVSSRRSGILHFDGFLLSKSYKFQLKRYRRVIQTTFQTIFPFLMTMENQSFSP